MLAVSSSCRARLAACRTLDACPSMRNRNGDKLVTEILTNWKPDMLTCLHVLCCLFAFDRLCVNACICVRVNASIYTHTYIYIYMYYIIYMYMYHDVYILIYIYICTSVDPNAYTCARTKTTKSKEAKQQMKTGQHVWLPICHHFGHQFVTISM